MTITTPKKQSILAFIKNLVNKTTYKAISEILSPCCTLAVQSITATCGRENYIVTVTLDHSVTLLGEGQASLYWNFGAPFNVVLTTVPWNDSNEMTFYLPDFFGAGTYDVTLELFLPTNSSQTIGVTLLSEPTSVIFPACPS